MFGKLLLCSVAAVLALTTAPARAQPADDQAAWAAGCEDWDEWDRPGPPFKVFGNTYYVGTCGISAILVAGDKRHFLIDGGTEAGGRMIADNIGQLGFSLPDVAFLLTSHEHHDHVGGFAYLQPATGAIVLAGQPASQVLESGIAAPDDPQAGMHPPMPKIEVGGSGVDDGDTVNLRGMKITALATPGHTPGALTWYWQSCDGSECKSIVYADSLSPVSSDTYRFSDHPEYVAAYRNGLARLAELDCDILLTPHPSASGMRDKLVAGDIAGGMSCREYAEGIGKRLDARLAEEAAAAQ